MAKRVRLPKAERESFWRRQINDWAQGGQTISGFCRERGLTVSAFHLWKGGRKGDILWPDPFSPISTSICLLLEDGP
jgi:hypothetical protein